MLIGIVKEERDLMQIDFALEAERQGTAKTADRSDLRRPCVIRFRPIMMTTMAAAARIDNRYRGSGYGRGRRSAASARASRVVGRSSSCRSSSRSI